MKRKESMKRKGLGTIFLNHISNRRLVPGIYKELSKFNSKKKIFKKNGQKI